MRVLPYSVTVVAQVRTFNNIELVTQAAAKKLDLELVEYLCN